MSTIARSGADEQRRLGLRRMRVLALSLLLLAAVVYLLTVGRSSGWGYLNAAAEAAMVGALADWFAVTALFRHPLGLPVPHTAIIPSRKNEIAVGLQDFVSDNFLTVQAVRERYHSANASRRFGQWLVEPDHARRVVAEASRAARAGVERVKDEDVRAVLLQAVIPSLVAEQLSPIAGHLLEEVVRDGAHHGLVDLALGEARLWLETNPELFAAILRERAPWWTPTWVDDRVIRRVHTEALAWVGEVRANPEHHARIALDALLVQLAGDLQHDPETMARAEALKARVLKHPQLSDAAVAVWNGLRRALLAALDDDDGVLRHRLEAQTVAFGDRLVTDAALRDRVDAYAMDAIGFVVQSYGPEVVSIITEVIDRWDGKEAARRIELHVGRDLQFIRINGTIVGGLAGLVIYAVTQLL